MSYALLFPGQGAQKIGMASDFLAAYPTARRLFSQADEVLGYSLSNIIAAGPESTLTLTRHCQPAIFVTSAAIVSVLEEQGLIDRAAVSACAGLSLGEYTALWFAGVFSFEEGVRLVALRGEHMQKASDHPRSGMVSLIGADLEQAEKTATAASQGEVLTIANILSPGQIVLSGAQSALDRVPLAAKEFGIRRVMPLSVAGAFHSALMQPAADVLIRHLDGLRLEPPRIPVYSNVGGDLFRDVDDIRRRLGQQVTQPVLWQKAMEAMVGTGLRRFLEPGPGRVLSGLLKKISSEAKTDSVETVEDLKSMKTESDS